MAKAICKVNYILSDQALGALSPTFDVPQGGVDEGADTLSNFGFQSISRVSEYLASSSEASLFSTGQLVYPYVKTNGVQAFVNETFGVLQVYPDQSNTTRYLIVPPKISPLYVAEKTINYVEITGQLKFRPVVRETDLLIIDDVDAIKLMLLALWREENNQMDLSKTLEAKAIEHLTFKTDSAIESARKVAYQSSITSFPYGTMGFVRSKLALDLKGGLRMSDGELNDLINKSLDILVDEYNFLIRNGRYGVKENLPSLVNSFTANDEQDLPIKDYSMVKLGVMAVQATNANQPEAYANYLKQALQRMEQNLAFDVETKRHTTYQSMLDSSLPGTMGYMKARLALDLPNGLSFSDKELTEMVNKAQERLIAHYNTLIKVGRYGVKDELPSFVYVKLVNDSDTLTISDYPAVRYEVMSNLALVSKEPNSSETAAVMDAQAIQKVEENLMVQLETKRHSNYKTSLQNATEGSYLQIKARLALELPDGLKLSNFEIEQGIKKAVEKLATKYNSLIKSGRFGVKSDLPLLPTPFDIYDSSLPPEPLRNFDIIKLAYLSIAALNSGSGDSSVAFEQQAFSKLEELVTLALETKRHAEYQALLDNSIRNTYGWAKARLALELPNGLKLSEKELSDLVLKGQEKLVSHYNYLIKAGRLGVKKPLDPINITASPSNSTLLHIQDFEATKASVLAVSSLSAGQADLALGMEKEAQNYLERNLVTALETERHTIYLNSLNSASPDSFGFFKARLALDLPDGLRLSDSEVGRLVNRAEETLILRGKWPGTVEEMKLTMPEDGNIYLPYNIETVLSAAMPTGKPIPIYGRSYDYHENGPGYSTADQNNRDPALIDRGETIADGRRVKVYFVRGNLGEEKCIRILYKRKAIPHTSDADKMYIINYPAILEMVLGFQAQASSPDKAKYHEDNAIRLLRAELEENKGPNRYNIKVQATAFALSEVQNLI
jgi:hypothetical protein